MDSPSETINTKVLRDVCEDEGQGAGVEEHFRVLKDLPLKPRDRYKFIRTIGIGGMKTVLLVHDEDTDRDVALAMMPDFRDRSDEEVARFIKEARITAKLEHPHIVPIHDIGLDANSAPYFVMTFLSGMMLSTLITRMRDGDTEQLKFYYQRKMLWNFQKICHAVEFAHSQNILHLDLKPANVHIGKFGEVHVLDWGLAHYLNKKEAPKKDFITKTIKIGRKKQVDVVAFGTPGYMAPEQAAGYHHHFDERTDIYSLGAILFTILTFRSPTSMMKDSTMEQLLKATITGTIIDDAEMKNDIRPVPPELEAICRKAMARNPRDRYHSVKDLRDDIGNYLTNYPTQAERPAAVKKLWLFVKRNMTKIAVFGSALLLLLLALFFWYLYTQDLITFNF